MISPSGQFLGAFVMMTDGYTVGHQVQHQSHRHGGARTRRTRRSFAACSPAAAIATTGGTFAALFFNSNAYSPGQVISNGTLPKGVSQTGMTLGTIAGNDRGEHRLRVAGLLGVHRFRHAEPRGHPRAARVERRAGVQWRAADRNRHHDHHYLAHARPDARGEQPAPQTRGHRLRPVRLLLAERRSDCRHDDHDDQWHDHHHAPSR